MSDWSSLPPSSALWEAVREGQPKDTPAANTCKECLQAAVSRRPDSSGVKLPFPFQTEIIFLENSALSECAYPFLGLISRTKWAKTHIWYVTTWL